MVWGSLLCFPGDNDDDNNNGNDGMGDSSDRDTSVFATRMIADVQGKARGATKV